MLDDSEVRPLGYLLCPARMSGIFKHENFVFDVLFLNYHVAILM